MRLSECNGKNVTIICIDGEVFSGLAYDYTPACDNTPEESSITIDHTEIYESEIREVTINSISEVDYPV